MNRKVKCLQYGQAMYKGVRFSNRVKDLPPIGKAEPYCRDFAAVRLVMQFQSRCVVICQETRN